MTTNMPKNQMPTTKQRRQVLIVSSLGIVVVIWATATYFFERPSIVITAEQTEPISKLDASDLSPTAPAPTSETNELTSLMQKLQKNPQDAQIPLDISKYFMRASDWQQAENFALKALDLEPDNPDALYILGMTQYNKGKYGEAAQFFQAALKKEKDPAVQYNLGVLYIHYLNDEKKGKQRLKEVLKNPKATPQLKRAAEEELKP